MLRDLFSLFPAYAGVILVKDEEESEKEAFPRIRGGDPQIVQTSGQQTSFSPHTRG